MIGARRHAFGAAVLTAVLLAGCGGSSSTVSGEVTYDGTPVENGTITFLPAAREGTPAAGPITDGHYTVSGLPPGRRIVQITAVKKLQFAKSREEARFKKGGAANRADIIPPNAEGNNAPVEVKAGDQVLNFALKKPARAKS